MKRDIVIAATSGYAFDQIKCWANSLERSGFTGERVVIVGNASLDLVRELSSRGFRVFTKGSREESSGYHYTKPNFLDHDMSIERFYLIWEFLRNSQDDEYRYVISVDIRDSIFQSDPSRWVAENIGDKKLLVSSEGLLCEDEDWNRGSMLEAFGPTVYSHMAKRMVWNCGAIAGEFSVFRDLCLNLYLCCIGRNVPYSDQAALNVLLSLDPFRALTRFDAGDLGWACHGGTMVDHGTVQDYAMKYRGIKPVLDGNFVRTSSGKTFCIVHQYDRIPEWNALLQAKYSMANCGQPSAGLSNAVSLISPRQGQFSGVPDGGSNLSPKQLVSVIIIFLNAEKFILEAIESVFAQTYDNWELLLVDDGSTDASTQIARRYMEQYPGRVRYLEHEDHQNLGMSAARNLGVRNASGAYIALLDSDDVWLPHKLERQVAILGSQPYASMIYGASQYWYSWTGNPDDVERDYIPDLGIQLDDLFKPPALSTLLYPLGKAAAPCPSNLLMRRDMIERIGGFEEEYRGMYEDQAFLAKVYLKEAVFVSGECWDRYRIHPESCVSISTRAGQYDSVRLFFLKWLEGYLSQQRITDSAIWIALRNALAPYCRPSSIEGSSTGEFADGDSEGRKWRLRVARGNVAKLTFPPGEEDIIRISIDKADSEAAFDIQLNQPRLKSRADHRYRLSFRGRADGPRNVFVGFALAHAPWTGLGLYKTIGLTPEWQDFDEEFVALSDDNNARILFDLGGAAVDVDLSSVCLRSVVDEQVVEPDHSFFTVLAPKDEASATGDPESRAGHLPPRVGQVQLGHLRHLTPISSDWGWDRGLPIDRYYIESFLAREVANIRGHVLEIGDNTYTVRFGGSNVLKSDVLHVTEGNPVATIVGDLTAAPHIPSASFDCILLIQTLQLIYDVRLAIQTLYRILKPGGVLLATFPGISQTYDRIWGNQWCWNFTPLSARRLFQEAFSEAHVKTEAFGNVLAAVSFLHGLATEELRQKELDYYEPGYEVTIAVKAMKPMITA
jgi:glycosyltransferase involved in cell wall biosynthesis